MRRVLLDGLWLVLVLLVTGAGMWLSSSLALYLNGPVWLAYLLGVFAFPVLPLAWEAGKHAEWEGMDEYDDIPEKP